MTAWLRQNPLAGFFAVSAVMHLAVLVPVYLKRTSSSIIYIRPIDVEWREENLVLTSNEPETKPLKEELREKKEPAVPLEPLPVYQRPLELSPVSDLAIDKETAPATDADGAKTTPQEALEDYVRHLRAEVGASIRFPEEYSRVGQEGAVEVVFILERGGELRAVFFPGEAGSVNPRFNREVIRAIRQASLRFRPFPQELQEEQKMTFRLPVTFLLH